MRDSLLRVIDDLETLRSVVKDHTNDFSKGYEKAMEYAIKELREVLDDHADTPNKRTTTDTE